MLRVFVNQRPLFYLKLYVGMIFAFALLFSLNSSSFYHSTISYEAGYDSHAEKLVTYYRDRIVTGMKLVNDKEECRKLREFDINSVKVVRWVVEDIERAQRLDMLTMIRFYIEYTAIEDNEIREFNTEVEVRAMYAIHPSNFAAVIMFPADGYSRSQCFGVDFTSRKITPGKPSPVEVDEFASFIDADSGNVPNDSVKKIGIRSSITMAYGPPQELTYGFYRLHVFGNPAGIDSTFASFVRMLYLSAVTISTLGYGDIVPVTTATRLLVGLESFIGVVIAGLFLTSLARGRTANH